MKIFSQRNKSEVTVVNCVFLFMASDGVSEPYHLLNQLYQ